MASKETHQQQQKYEEEHGQSSSLHHEGQTGRATESKSTAPPKSQREDIRSSPTHQSPQAAVLGGAEGGSSQIFFAGSPIESSLLPDQQAQSHPVHRHFTPPLPVSPSSLALRKDSKKEKR